MINEATPTALAGTITSWGRSKESEAFKNVLTKFPNCPVSVVSDSYDIWNACENIWGEELKDQVEDRGKRGVGPVVVRPDSGDPTKVVLKVLEILGSKFGTTLNSKGYKLLPPYIRVIQGDGINYESLKKILEHMKLHNWSSDNIAFGSGGGLLQEVNKDTLKCVYKCSYAVVNGKGISLHEQKGGLKTLEFDNEDKYVTKTDDARGLKKDLLVTVFENGEITKEYTLEEVRERAELPIVKKLN